MTRITEKELFAGKPIGQQPYSYTSEAAARDALEAFHEDRMEKLV